MLNGNTDVKSMPDKGKRMYCFEVTCGKTGVPFEICSDDQRSKHDWMLAIKKVCREREREREREVNCSRYEY